MKTIQYITAVLCSLVFVGCSDFSDSINTDPNKPGVASGTQLIANAALFLPDLSSSPRGEFMAQYLAETQYVGASLYPQESTSFYYWYEEPLMNLQAAIESDDLDASEGPIANQLAMARILKAYFFWNVTDRWGDVPYSKALQGADNFTAAYDTQESIYNDLFNELKEAVEMIEPEKVDNDIIYGGDMSQWQKLANTIRLLMALRLSEVAPARAMEEFKAAHADGVFASNGDNLVFHHLADANNQNYWYNEVVNRNREWWALTETLVAEMKPADDPRLPVYGDPARASGEYTGLKFGEEEDISTEKYSLMGPAIYAQDASIYLVTYAQVLFALAEAAERGWISGDIEALYNQAIEASIAQWTGSTQGVGEFLAKPGIAFEPANALKMIATQRWVHLYMFGYEAWAEWRRTGYPDNLVEPNGVAVPGRLSYPDNEAFNNTENYEEAVQRQFGGDDSIHEKVWWDVD
ncbi:SusD/RagB family nutrient-binding outer membrane lipoprotein [Sinomicrobium weinanense]|uniref:SusD/RagB family nutrient-binding outer membrane lipoprotein n=1 Tax=Sinomicrobium weinanense TaxID=2842200 RepID=A0A926JRX3_9FLAO|nr:SusD/RagB family nutrient-binding outer membrane lipoprotein [Sinomicrobium weinanense]MBC9796158.1 SusD/RagB family nutrient-binding outer membrane lipoprotein [Sinomicrobium weinanense]MBU3121909.1 SusD/RagB family nutrient-binding outer membrane lipoprotein [Sinomicrobium weinanense]